MEQQPNTPFDPDGFVGTEYYYDHGLTNPKIKMTDGVMSLAERGCYWLMDIIHTEIFPLRYLEPFMSITGTVGPEDRFEITVTDGNYNEIHKRKITFTDFERQTGLTEIKFFLVDGVLMLTGEY